ncbi:MAG TPA: endonuclease/exonuclease/phosphatase family protein [Gemmatimonadales bacterium]|nr:endonuclease/exonuclease/phosphatase family protein [Gemmatimonadales bacterium]
MPRPVPCASGQHRVRLDPQRYWRSARCPVCRAPVDRWRVRRAVELVWPERWTRPVQVSWAAFGAAVLVLVTLYGLGDRQWLGTTILFAGRWIWLVPIVGWLLVLLAWRPRPLLPSLVPTLAAAWVVLFGVMDLQTGWRALWPSSGPTIRVLTFNVAGRAEVAQRIPLLLERWAPDVAVFQECGPALVAELQQLEGWTVETTEGCLATRGTLDRVEAMPRENIRAAEGAGLVVRYRLRVDDRPLVVTSIHLETARHGLERLLVGANDATGAVEDNTTLRDIEHLQARRFIAAGGGPAIVAGDFNVPDESAIYRRHWRDLTNAFATAGRGFGYTKDTGWIDLRIDHILVDDAFRVVGAWVGESIGSDHAPVIADLAF